MVLPRVTSNHCNNNSHGLRSTSLPLRRVPQKNGTTGCNLWDFIMSRSSRYFANRNGNGSIDQGGDSPLRLRRRQKQQWTRYGLFAGALLTVLGLSLLAYQTAEETTPSSSSQPQQLQNFFLHPLAPPMGGGMPWSLNQKQPTHHDADRIVAEPLSTTLPLMEQIHWEWSMHEQSTTAQFPPRTPVPIFYNVFIPDGGTDTQLAYAIVQEQLQQIAESYAGGEYHSTDESTTTAVQRRPVTLYYTTIGPQNLLGQQRMSNHSVSHDFCQRYPHFHCLHMGHFVTGEESYTLQRMQQYCFRHPTERVTYLHSKGSFHQKPDNDQWRRALTLAATARDCQEPPDASCHVCGIHFFTQFSMIVPGNMYTADCGYVTKLLSPVEAFPQRHEEAVADALLLRLRRQLTSYSLYDRKDYFGLDRYSSEHWIASHPDLIPCDMDPSGDIGAIFRGTLTHDKLQWALGPRIRGIGGDIAEVAEAVWNRPELSEREYFLLPGFLLKWHRSYGAFPPANSWVWHWYPDGQQWLLAIQAFGGNAVEHLTSQRYYTLDNDVVRRTAFYQLDNHAETTTKELNPRLERSQITERSKDIAIFYHVFAQTPQSIVHEQLEAAKRAALTLLQVVPIFVSVVGSTTDNDNSEQLTSSDVQRMCQNQTTENHEPNYNFLECHGLPNYDVPYEGETLRQLHRYCRRFPSSTVIYLQSELPQYLQSPEENQQHNFNLLLHLTRAALSTSCLEVVTTSTNSHQMSTCNVCGLIFYRLWTLFYPGNMFTAPCHYVNQLLPPPVFETKMIEYTKQALLTRLRWNLQSNVFRGTTHSVNDTLSERLQLDGLDRLEYWGVDRFAVDHWITSHPSLDPCDLSGDTTQDFEFWRHTDAPIAVDLTPNAFQVWYSSAVPAPTHPGAPVNFNKAAFHSVMWEVGLRMREITFLGGHLLRWFFLYNQAPSCTSRIWSWFPDSDEWRDGTTDFGVDVVSLLTEPHVQFTTN